MDDVHARFRAAHAAALKEMAVMGLGLPVEPVGTNGGRHYVANPGSEPGDSGQGTYLPGSVDAPDLPCPSYEMTVAVADLRDLADVCTIHLGYCDEEAMDLTAEVPRGYEPETEQADMFTDFLPEWYEKLDPDTEMWSLISGCIKYRTDDLAGLFWKRGGGFYHKALKYALATLYKHADYADDPALFADSCGGMDADRIRDQVEDERRWIKTGRALCTEFSPRIRVETNGKVRPQFGDSSSPIDIHTQGSIVILGQPTDINIEYGGALAITYGGTIHICDYYTMQAALADYYFWWAHRLHSYYTSDSNATSVHRTVGMYCARAGLSEIVEIAAGILHELGHIVGSSWHCHLGTSRFNCCQYVLQSFFRHRMLALYGLPYPHFSVNSDYQQNDSDDDFLGSVGRRFQLYKAGNTWGRDELGLDEGDDSCGAAGHSLKITATHDSVINLNHSVTIDWELPDHGACTDDGNASSGSETYPQTNSSGTDHPDREHIDDELPESPVKRPDRKEPP